MTARVVRPLFMSIVALALLAMLPIAPLPLAGPALAALSEPLKVGVMMPLTGSTAGYGQMCLEGIHLAQAMAPAAAGRTLELIVVDTKGDPTEAANGATRLATKDKVIAILGPVLSSTSLAAGNIAESHQLPMITPTATNPMVTQGKHYVFRTCFLDSNQGQAAANYLAEHMGKQDAAVLIDVSQDYSVALAGYFMKAYKKLGGKVVSVNKFGRDAQDFSPQLAAIKASGARVLYLPFYAPESGLVARQAKELGLDIALLSGDGAHTPELLQIGGPAVEGLRLTAHFDPDAAQTPRAADFFQRFRLASQSGQIREDLTAFQVLGAEGYLVLRDALERSGGAGGDKLRQALLDPSGFDIASGHIVIGPDGNAVKKVMVLKVQGGKFVHEADVSSDAK